MSNRAVLNGNFSQRFDPDSNVTWSEDCFSAVSRPVDGGKLGDKAQQEIDFTCKADPQFPSDTFICNFNSVPANHEVRVQKCLTKFLIFNIFYFKANLSS